MSPFGVAPGHLPDLIKHLYYRALIAEARVKAVQVWADMNPLTSEVLRSVIESARLSEDELLYVDGDGSQYD